MRVHRGQAGSVVVYPTSPRTPLGSGKSRCVVLYVFTQPGCGLVDRRPYALGPGRQRARNGDVAAASRARPRGPRG